MYLVVRFDDEHGAVCFAAEKSCASLDEAVITSRR